MRKAHYLRVNLQGELPSLVAFVDTETRATLEPDGTQHHKLYIGYVEVWRRQGIKAMKWYLVGAKVFTTALDFWQFISSSIRSKGCLYLFAHNWQFDGAILGLDTLPLQLGYRCKKLILDSGIAIIKFKSERKSIHVLDTANYFHVSLEQLGKDIGVAKLSMPDFSDSLDSWVVYCKNDVAILRAAIFNLIDFIHSNDLGNFQPTAASLAFGAFRHRFMSVKILIHSREKILELERQAYHGGRVEAFYIGEISEPLYQLDINSMYPYVMSLYPYPVILKRSLYHPSIETIRDLLSDYSLIASVKLRTSEPVYPVKHNDKIVYPVGEFTTVLSTPEIAYAITHNHLVSVSYAAVYYRSKIFTPYVTEFYRLRMFYRETGNYAFEYLCKLMLNSLYGKFGQRSGGWVDVEYNDLIPPGFTEWLEYDVATGETIKYRSLMGKVQVRQKGGESYNSFPAIAAHVTAYSRVLLWRLIRGCGVDNVFYVDTDSLMINENGLAYFTGRLARQGLGGMKIEKAAASGFIYGAKDYRLGDKVKLKGIRKTAIYLGDNTYKQDMFRKWIPQLRDGIQGEIIVKSVIKVLKREYDKGVVTPTGKVIPYSLGL